MKSLLPVLVLIVLSGCSPAPTANERSEPASADVQQTSSTVQESQVPDESASINKPVKTVEPPKVAEHSPLFQWASTKESGLAKAKANGGYVMLKFEADWCGPCQIMKREAFQNKDVAKLLKNAVVVPVDVDTEAGQRLAAQYHADQIPKIVFMKGDGKVFGEILGYMNVEWLQREVNSVFKRANFKG